MCANSEWKLSTPLASRRPKRSKIQVRRLTRLTRRRDGEEVGTEMEIENLKLYLENRNIIEENEKLKKKALLLHHENQTLLSQLQNSFTHLHEFSHQSCL